jgi:transglutaminase-like putative cysteine protease
LLFRPGDLIFVSAPLLESLVGNRKSIGIADVYKFWEPSNYYLTYPIYLSWFHMDELLYFLWKLWRNGLLTPFFPPYFIGILGFSHFSPNIHEFVDDYLRGNIGELIYSYIGKYKTPALDFLHELLSAIMRKAQRERRAEIMDFVNEFFRYPYGNGEGGLKEGVEFDYEGGGIGIIYTSINLGEG